MTHKPIYKPAESRSAEALHAEIQTLADRYFEALTTDAEEDRLRRLLCTPAGMDSRYDDIRAVLGFVSVGRDKYLAEACHAAQKPRKRFHYFGKPHFKPLYRRVGAVAAVVAVVGVTALSVWKWMGSDPYGNICVAYVGNCVITDEEQVLQEMKNTLADVNGTDAPPTVEGQLEDMFNTLKEDKPT